MRRVWNRFWRGGVLGRDLRRQSLHSGESFEFRWRLLLCYFGDLVPAASEDGVSWGIPRRFVVRAWLLCRVPECDSTYRSGMT
jgi:hypothetical protein